MNSPSERPSVSSAASGGAMRHVVVGVRAWGETVFWGLVGGMVFGPLVAILVVGIEGGIDLELIALLGLAATLGFFYGLVVGVGYGAVVGVPCGIAIGVASRVIGARAVSGAWTSGERLGTRIVAAAVAGVSTALVGVVPASMAGDQGELSVPVALVCVVVPAVVAAAVFAWRTPTILTAPTPTLASRRHGVTASRRPAEGVQR